MMIYSIFQESIKYIDITMLYVTFSSYSVITFRACVTRRSVSLLSSPVISISVLYIPQTAAFSLKITLK